jgi:hypothetical protein
MRTSTSCGDTRQATAQPDRFRYAHDYRLRDLIERLDRALVVVEAAERVARTAKRRDRLHDAANTVNAAVDYLCELREARR